MNTQEFIKLVKRGDDNFSSAFTLCKDAAGMLFPELDPEAEPKAEHARVLGLGKKLIADKEIKLKHEADVWKYIRNQLLVLAEPTYQVEQTRKGGNVLLPAEKVAATVRGQKAAAAAIRDALGMSDGRANARGKKAPKADKKASKAVDMLASIASMLKNNDTRDAIFSLIVEAGFTKPRRKATK